VRRSSFFTVQLSLIAVVLVLDTYPGHRGRHLLVEMECTPAAHSIERFKLKERRM